MKRVHIHVSVANLEHAVGFYSALFEMKPAIFKHDYAKWMLDDPRVNFAISTRGREPGLDHLGIQAENQTGDAVGRGRRPMALADVVSAIKAINIVIIAIYFDPMSYPKTYTPAAFLGPPGGTQKPRLGGAGAASHYTRDV